MRRLKKAFINLTLQKKLIFIYVVAFILPVIFITFYSITGMMRISNEKNFVQNQAQCNQIAANIEVKLSEFYKSVLSFSNSPVINSYFEYKYPDSSSFFSIYPKVNLHITSFLVSNPQVHNFVIYTDNPTFIKNAYSIKTLTEEIDADYETLQKLYENPPVIAISMSGSQNNFELNFFRKIAFTKAPKYHTLLSVSYPEEILYSFYQHESDKLNLYLISPTGEIISSNNRGLIGSSESSEKIIEEIEQYNLPESRLTEKDQNYYYMKSFSDSSFLRGWKIYMQISNEPYMKEVGKLTAQALLLISLLSMLGLLLYVLCSVSVTKRLNRLVNAMSGVRDDESLDVRLETDSKDEIGILSENFSQMLLRIKKLIFDVYSTDLQVKDLEIKNKQAELLALQSQIHPHFLFNTMQSLAISCYNNDDYETAAYINKFCAFLRDCLYWETKCVPLSEEIRVIENYLSLQKLRYTDTLDYQIQIPEEFYELLIPKFTLQPIVENAIEHGLEGKNTQIQKGFISITAVRHENRISITIRDNGAGIPAAQLENINCLLKKQSGTGDASSCIGIFNTNERLKLFYGPDFGIEIQSHEGEGTIVSITITGNL